MDKQQGTVKFFNTEKGFGFIKHNDSNKETFVHVSGLKSQNIKEGDSVEIFGDHLPITVLSDVLGTIPYEVLTSVSTRVKRVYYQE